MIKKVIKMVKLIKYMKHEFTINGKYMCVKLYSKNSYRDYMIVYNDKEIFYYYHSEIDKEYFPIIEGDFFHEMGILNSVLYI